MTVHRPTFILVPGAYHLPSTWDLLRGELDSLGYASRAVKLPTAGPDPRGDLHDDADVIRAAIETSGGPVVVVAHSYSGLPVTEGAVGLPNLRHLVYVAAFVPDVGESMYSIVGVPEPESTEGLFPPIEDPRAQFYADVPDELADVAVRRIVSQLHQPFADRVTQAVARRPVHLHHHGQRRLGPGAGPGADGRAGEARPQNRHRSLPAPGPARRTGRAPGRGRQDGLSVRQRDAIARGSSEPPRNRYSG